MLDTQLLDEAPLDDGEDFLRQCRDNGVMFKHATPNGEQEVLEIARVSNPLRAKSGSNRLLTYLIREGHWSPFEMVNLCLAVYTTRDVGRQLLRHSLRPQEFSQRYAEASILGEPIFREARLEHPTNRQMSIVSNDETLEQWWRNEQQEVWDRSQQAFKAARRMGIAKECARAVNPEGLTPTFMYFNGNLRDHLFMWWLRKGHGTQPETIAIAKAAWNIMHGEFPQIVEAFEQHMQEQHIANQVKDLLSSSKTKRLTKVRQIWHILRS
jgi:thymidylate synthase (FAD)